MPPSNLIVSPLIITLSIILITNFAYSSGVPKRDGKGIEAAKLSRISCGMPSNIGVPKRPGAIVFTREALPFFE